MIKIGKNLFFTLLLAASFSVFAEEAPKITTIVQPNPVALDDSLQLRIQVATESKEPAYAPEFEAPAFTVVGKSSSRSVNMNIGSGGPLLSQTTIYTYVLLPKAVGAQKISNIKVKVGDKEYPVADMMVKVLPGTNGASSNQDEESSDEDLNPAAPQTFGSAGKKVTHPKSLNSDFTVFVELDKNSAYQGEPIVASYWIYASAPLREINIKRWPNFNGFWKEDLMIPARYDWEQVMINGRIVNRALVGRFALFGIKPGKIRLEQLLVSAKYIDASGGGGLNDDPFFFPTFSGRLRTGSHGSAPEQIEILPLPESGRPSDFGGAVGEFKISFSQDKNEVTANSPVNFIFALEGTGNFHAIEKIKIPFPQDFEIYDTKTSFQANAQIGATRSLANKKTFTYLVLPRKEGVFTIPELKFSYFDPEKKVYRTFTTEPKTVKVLADPNAGNGGTNNYAATQDSQNTTPSKLELRFLKVSSAETPALSKWIVRILILINAFFLLYLGMRRISISEIKDRLSRSPKRRIALAVARLERSSTVKSDHYRAIESAVLQIEGIILNKAAAGMTKDEREQAWKALGLPAKLFLDLEEILTAAEKARYQGGGSEKLATEIIAENSNKIRALANAVIKHLPH